MSGKKSKSHKLSKKKLAAVLLILIIISVAIFFWYSKNHNPASSIEKTYNISDKSSCEDILKVADKLIIKNELKKANTVLESKKESCQDVKKITEFNYYARFAAVKYILKNKTTAKQYASKALGINKQMPSFERQTNPNYESALVDMQQIQNDSYQGDALFY